MEERRGAERADGPEDAGARAAMGQGLRSDAWEKFYDLNYDSREAQAAVDAMPRWREAQLGRGRREQQQAAPIDLESSGEESMSE